MTVETTPTPSPETPNAPAPEAAPKSQAAQRAERRARAEARIAAPPKTPAPAPPNDEAAPAEPAAAESSAPAAGRSKLDLVKEKLAQQAQARAERKAVEERESRIAKLEESVGKLPQMSATTADSFFDELDRDPVATIRKYKRDPKKYLDALTADALSPGSVRALAEAQEGKSEAQKLREEWQRDKEAREAAEAERAYAAERSAIVAHAKSDESRWGLLAKLPETRRLQWCMTAYEALTQAGHDYDRELVLDAAEALLEEDYKHLSPSPDPKPAPSPQAQSQVATKKPAKTLTPDMAAPSGSKRPKTRAERKEALVAQLERDRSRAP